MSGFFSSFARVSQTLKIPSGQTKGATSILNGIQAYHDAVVVGIFSPSGMTETVTIYGHDDPSITDPTDAGWFPVQSYRTGSLANLTAPAGGTMQQYSEFLSCASIMLVAGANVGNDRIFRVTKIYTA